MAERKAKKTLTVEDRLKSLSHDAIDVLEELLEMSPPHVRIKAVAQIIELNNQINERERLEDAESDFVPLVIYLPEKGT